MRPRLSRSPPALAALHAQANEIVAGGLPALRARLAALHGTPVVINKWASWCEPCREEFGVFQRVSVSRGRQVAFLGIDSEDTAGPRARVPALVPPQLSELLRPERAGGPRHHRLLVHASYRVHQSHRQQVHPPRPLPERREARTGRQALRAGRLTLRELRIDPLSGHRTIIAGERSRRPGGEPRCEPPEPIDPEKDPVRGGPRGPHAARALRGATGRRSAELAGLAVRVVPNLYPALTPPDEHAPAPATPPAETRGAPELFVSREATGAHEVIINGPQPVLSLAELPLEQVLIAVETWRERMRVHAASPYVQLIVNERREAGASLPHTHAQLYALDFVPAAVARERERAGAYTTRTMGQNLVGDLVAEEVRRRERIIAIDDEAVLLAPYASRLPFQMMLAPRAPRPRFEDAGASGAALLHDGLRRLARHLGSSPPLNLWVRTAPLGTEDFCWRIDVMPRLTHIAGLELSTEVNLNIVAPEHAAAVLRDA